jgi:glyoxylate reductase
MSSPIAFTWPLPGDEIARLAEVRAVRVREGGELLDEAGLAEFIGNAEAVVTLLADPMTDRVMAACPSLRVIANCAVGYDNIDLEAARRRGIWVTNTPDVLTEATADLAWALILAVTRRVVEGDAMVRQGGFHGWRPDLLLGTGLQGKTLGIVGYGRIGRAVARRAAGFGMEVAYSDSEERPEPGVSARRLSLEQLLAASHVLSIHCPLTPETHHILDVRNLRLLPDGAFVVNTARGPVIDEEALVAALESGRLAGVGLDVYEAEPDVHPGLLGRTNVVLLPHVGSATLETRSAMAGLAIENAVAVLDGREPPTPVVRGD